MLCASCSSAGRGLSARGLCDNSLAPTSTLQFFIAAHTDRVATWGREFVDPLLVEKFSPPGVRVPARDRCARHGRVYRAMAGMPGTRGGKRLKRTRCLSDPRCAQRASPIASPLPKPRAGILVRDDRCRRNRDQQRMESEVLRLPKVYGPGSDANLATVYQDRNHPTGRWTHGYVENVAADVALAANHPRAAKSHLQRGRGIYPDDRRAVGCPRPE